MSDGNPYQRTVAYQDTKPDGEVTKFLLRAEEIIKLKISHYRGYYKNQDGEWIQIYSKDERLMNDKGIEFAQRQFYNFLNKNTILADLKEKQAEQLILEYSHRIRRIMFRNIRNFGLKSVAAIDEVKNDLCEMAWLVLTQCINGKGRTFTYKPIQSIQHSTFQDTPSTKTSKIGW